MKAVFAGEIPDYTPAVFWFHYPAGLTAEEAADAHVQLYHQLDNDIIKIMDDSFGHMVTEGIKIEKPSDLQVLNAVKAAGGYNILHICGEAEHGFRSSPERYAGYPGDLFNWDTHRTDVSLEAGKKLFHAPILGGLDNHGLLIEGSLEEIAAESRKIITEFGKKGFMLGADCTVPNTINIARLQTAVNAAKE